MAQSTNQPSSGALAQVSRTVQLVWRLLNDPRVPLLTKLIIPGVFVYVISPLDLVPDFIPGLGQLDDLALIVVGVRFFIDLCPPDVVLEHRRALMGESSGAQDDYVDATYRVLNSQDKGK